MTPERRAEAQQAGDAFHLALALIGVASFEEVVGLWSSLPESEAPAAIDRWLDTVVGATTRHKRQARDLAHSYYRLIRALHTGTTVVDPWSDSLEPSTLGSLRREFSTHVKDATGQRPVDLIESVPETDDEVVIEEQLDGVDVAESEDEEDSEDEQRDFLVANLEHYRVKRERSRGQREERRARADAAAVTGSSGQKGALDGARSALHSVERADRRAIGYVRLSRTGDPCAFCRMLMSRGITFKYGSRARATYRADGEKYHPNCQCYAEPVFSESQYENDPRFALNRELSALWPQVTEGYGGRDALNAWRRYWYARQRRRGRRAA